MRLIYALAVLATIVMYLPLPIAAADRPLDPAILEGARAFEAAMRTQDAAAIAALFRDDGTELVPGRPPITGRTAIEQYFRTTFSEVHLTAFAVTPLESSIAGDQAFEAGTFTESLRPASGEPLNLSGNYVVVLRRTGNAWKIAYSIYNTEQPPAGRLGAAPGSSHE